MLFRSVTILLLLAVVATAAGQNKNLPSGYRALEISYVTLNLVDLGTTIYGINNGAIERNPLFKNYDAAGMVGVKLVAVSGYLLLNRQLLKVNPKAARISLVIVNAIYGAVAINNISVVIKLNR